MKRRQFLCASVGLPAAATGWASAPDEKRMVAPLHLEIDEKADWGAASPGDILSVCQSAAHQIWQHCAGVAMPGIFVCQGKELPMCAYEHDEQKRVVIFLTVKDRVWNQIAYQFAHEFCHALAGHTDAWERKKRGLHANKWLEEALCECASLFALRSMAKVWRELPPFPNWKGYAEALANYAQERLDKKEHQLPEKGRLSDWLRLNEAAMRENATLRTQNTVVAAKLLPIFEKSPSAWRAVPWLNLAKQDGDISLSEHVKDWKEKTPEADRGVFEGLGEAFGIQF